ncbi:hypothetical protein HMPREF1868_00672 [Olsenella sp. DNF00959]|nr:hypothetical protein HMPREF1868_00672 [Olsenella sp. DNF00959]
MVTEKRSGRPSISPRPEPERPCGNSSARGAHPLVSWSGFSLSRQSQ